MDNHSNNQWNIHLSLPHYQCNHKKQQKQREDLQQAGIHFPARIKPWFKCLRTQTNFTNLTAQIEMQGFQLIVINITQM